MSLQLVACDICENELVTEALFCPRCLSSRKSVRDEWFPVDGTGFDNPVVEHDLVPQHRIYPEQKVKEMLREYDIDRTDLPKIKGTDPALDHLEVTDGDVIKIVRDSRTTDQAVTYRLVVSNSNRGGGSTTAEWRNPDDPAAEVYEVSDDLTEDQALHILENVRAHVPPAEPGACRRIAVNREPEIETAISRLRDGVPYTFIQGELGYGKSFFLYWIRDEVFSSSAVSIIDLGDETTFTNPATVVRAFRDRLETPRSIANPDYANGLDELWDTLLRQVSDICASYYERQGYELRRDRMVESIRRASDDLLSETDISEDMRSTMVGAASDHFDGSLQSLSQSLLGEITDESAFEYVEVMAILAKLNGYRLMLGVDELEKAERSVDHFAAIIDFVEELPENVSVFVTGTPELVEGGEEGNAFQETHRELYNLTIENRIALENPTRANLQEFTYRLLSIEEQVLSPSEREYTAAVGEYEDVDVAIEGFLDERPPTFRGYLEFLENATA